MLSKIRVWLQKKEITFWIHSLVLLSSTDCLASSVEAQTLLGDTHPKSVYTSEAMLKFCHMRHKLFFPEQKRTHPICETNCALNLLPGGHVTAGNLRHASCFSRVTFVVGNFADKSCFNSLGVRMVGYFLSLWCDLIFEEKRKCFYQIYPNLPGEPAISDFVWDNSCVKLSWEVSILTCLT